MEIVNFGSTKRSDNPTNSPDAWYRWKAREKLHIKLSSDLEPRLPAEDGGGRHSRHPTRFWLIGGPDLNGPR